MFITVYYYIHPMQPGFTWMDRILGRGLRRDCPVAGADRNDRGPSTGSGRTGGSPPRSPLPSRERGFPSTGSGRTGGSPSPPYQVRGRLQPSPIKGEGMSFDGLRMNGGVGAARLPRRCASRNDRGPSTGSGRTGGSASPQPSPIKGEGMSFDGLRTNGPVGPDGIATSQGFIR